MGKRSKLAVSIPTDNLIVTSITGFKYNEELRFVVNWADSTISEEPLENIKDFIEYHKYIDNLFDHVHPRVKINNKKMEKKLKYRIAVTMNTKPKSFILNLIETLDMDEFYAHRVLFHFIEKNDNFHKRYDDLFFKHHFKLMVDEQANSFHKLLLEIRMKENMTVTISNEINFKTPSPFRYITWNLLPESWTEENERQCAVGKPVDGQPCTDLGEALEWKQVLDMFYTGDRRGWGLRTIMKINKGTVIEECLGDLVKEEEAAARPNKSFFFAVQLCNTNERFTIDAANNGNLARFVNHSCSPNSRFFITCFCSGPLKHKKLVLVALKDIEKNAEITVDYTLGSLEITQGIACRCGAEKCVGIF